MLSPLHVSLIGARDMTPILAGCSDPAILRAVLREEPAPAVRDEVTARLKALQRGQLPLFGAVGGEGC